MNRIIQKTTSVILSLATVALIGAPAFAAYEPQEALNDIPASAAEAVAEPTEGKDKIEIEESGKEETAQAQNAEPASTAAEETEEEPTEEKSETETAVPEETPDETETERGGSELDGVSEDEIIRSFSIDEADNEPEETENSGEETTDEESIKENAMLPFIELAEKAENSFSDLIYVIGAPILIFVPIFGMAAIIDGFTSLFNIFALPLSFIGACIEACEIYFATNGSK